MPRPVRVVEHLGFVYEKEVNYLEMGAIRIWSSTRRLSRTMYCGANNSCQLATTIASNAATADTLSARERENWSKPQPDTPRLIADVVRNRIDWTFGHTASRERALPAVSTTDAIAVAAAVR